MKRMININCYVNLGNEVEWNEFVEWYKNNIGQCKHHFWDVDSEVVKNEQVETIAYQNVFDGERGYYVEGNFYIQMINEERNKSEDKSKRTVGASTDDLLEIKQTFRFSIMD